MNPECAEQFLLDFVLDTYRCVFGQQKRPNFALIEGELNGKPAKFITAIKRDERGECHHFAFVTVPFDVDITVNGEKAQRNEGFKPSGVTIN